MKHLYLFIVFAFTSTVPSLALAQDADDFFAKIGEDETEEQEAEQGAGSSFTIMNMMGSTPPEQEVQQKRARKAWGDFEDISGSREEKAYLDSGEVKLKRELRKPLPERNPFGNRLDSLEDSVNGLKAPNVIETLSK